MKKAATVADYLAGVPAPARATLEKIRATVRAAVPDAEEVITYQMPGFKRGKALLAYAAFTEHCSIFPMSAAVMRDLAADLARYETAKGTIRFAIGKPPPAALIRKILKVRLAEIERTR